MEMFTCERCGTVRSLEDLEYELDETASMVCPVCKSKYEIAATLIAPGGEHGGAGGGIEEPEPGPPEPGDEEPGAPGGEPPVPGAGGEELQIEPQESATPRQMAKLMESTGRRPIGEADDAPKDWAGDLSTFSAKILGLAEDLAVDFDQIDALIAALEEKEALEIKGDEIRMDVEKAADVIVDFLSGMGAAAPAPSAPVSGEVPVGNPPASSPEPDAIAEPPPDLGNEAKVSEADDAKGKDAKELLADKVKRALGKFFESRERRMKKTMKEEGTMALSRITKRELASLISDMAAGFSQVGSHNLEYFSEVLESGDPSEIAALEDDFNQDDWSYFPYLSTREGGRIALSVAIAEAIADAEAEELDDDEDEDI